MKVKKGFKNAENVQRWTLTFKERQPVKTGTLVKFSGRKGRQ